MNGRAPTTQEHAFDVLQDMQRYNGWIAAQFRSGRPPGRLLEIGAGVGNLTRCFLDATSILAIDHDPAFLGELRRRLGGTPGLTIEGMDITDPANPLGDRRFDSMLMVNVLEHIKDDRGTLATLAAHLAPGGRLHVLVPAHPALYGGVDREAGHVRRYRRGELTAKLEGAGLRVAMVRHFNLLGALGWWVNMRLLGRRYLPPGQARLMERLVPLLRLLETVPPPFGLSLVATAVRP